MTDHDAIDARLRAALPPVDLGWAQQPVDAQLLWRRGRRRLHVRLAGIATITVAATVLFTLVGVPALRGLLPERTATVQLLPDGGDGGAAADAADPGDACLDIGPELARALRQGLTNPDARIVALGAAEAEQRRYVQIFFVSAVVDDGGVRRVATWGTDAITAVIWFDDFTADRPRDSAVAAMDAAEDDPAGAASAPEYVTIWSADEVAEEISVWYPVRETHFRDMDAGVDGAETSRACARIAAASTTPPRP